MKKDERRRDAVAHTYVHAIREIYLLDKFGSRLGLERIRAILTALGNPQKKYRCILVGGSNGKGSTTEMIGAILQENGVNDCGLKPAASHDSVLQARSGWVRSSAGLSQQLPRTRSHSVKVGTYFSPQIERFEERFRVNGKNASRREIANAHALVAAACKKVAPEATFFEVVTAMALVIFEKRKVDYAVLEVGLGGRLDATNAVEPDVSVLTSLSLEHADVLGNTLEKIAHEKCGIARKGKQLVCGVVSGRAGLAVAKECAHAGAIAIFVEDDTGISNLREKRGCFSFDAEYGGKYSVFLSAPGKFQVSNAQCALVACSLLGVGRKAVERGLTRAKPAYRLQKMGRTPVVIADCAHNPEAAAALAFEVKAMRAEKKVLLFSAMKDKDYQTVLRTLAPLFDEIVITEVKLERGETIANLGKATKDAGARHFQLARVAAKALARAKRIAGKNGLVVVAGSIYLLAEIYGRDKIRVAQ